MLVTGQAKSPRAWACLLVPWMTLACADVPRDPRGTLDRVRGGELVVGVSDSPPWIRRDGHVATGPEADLVRGIAKELGARAIWKWGALEDHLGALERFELDLVAGGLTKGTPWRDRVGLTRPWIHREEGGGVLAVAPGENGFLTAIEITGVAMGLWWADALAGSFISLSIVKDGVGNLSRFVKDLVDHRPTTVEGEICDVPERVQASVGALPWVTHAQVRLREEGHLFPGEIFVSPSDGLLTVERVRAARQAARSVDWRVHDVVVTVAPLPR